MNRRREQPVKVELCVIKLRIPKEAISIFSSIVPPFLDIETIVVQARLIQTDFSKKDRAFESNIDVIIFVR